MYFRWLNGTPSSRQSSCAMEPTFSPRSSTKRNIAPNMTNVDRHRAMGGLLRTVLRAQTQTSPTPVDGLRIGSKRFVSCRCFETFARSLLALPNVTRGYERSSWHPSLILHAAPSLGPRERASLGARERNSCSTELRSGLCREKMVTNIWKAMRQEKGLINWTLDVKEAYHLVKNYNKPCKSCVNRM